MRYETGEYVAGGGGGDVWRDASNAKRCIKLFVGLTEEDLAEKKEKLEFLMSSRNPSFSRLVLPADIVYQSKGSSRPAGYVMPYFEGDTLDQVAGGSASLRLRVELAQHLAHAVANLDSQGVIMSDLRLENVMLTQSGLRFIDCDSYGFYGNGRYYRHQEVESPTPEMMGLAGARGQLSSETNYFQLALCVMALLFCNVNPYRDQSLRFDDSKELLNTRIYRGLTVFSNADWRTIAKVIGPELAGLLRSSFEDRSHRLPTAVEYERALGRLVDGEWRTCKCGTAFPSMCGCSNCKKLAILSAVGNAARLAGAALLCAGVLHAAPLFLSILQDSGIL